MELVHRLGLNTALHAEKTVKTLRFTQANLSNSGLFLDEAKQGSAVESLVHPATITVTVFGAAAALALCLGIVWLFSKKARLKHLAELRSKLSELSPTDPEYGPVRALYMSMVIDAQRWGFFKSETSSGSGDGGGHHSSSDHAVESGGSGDGAWRYLYPPGLVVVVMGSGYLGYLGEPATRMTLLHFSGFLLVCLALSAALILYGTLKLGRFMHASPYVILLVGAILLTLAPDAQHPLGTTLFYLCLILGVHAAVYFDMKGEKG